ncbi:MAG TPA: response regulator transcription factor [Candidatus Dormibacteraeota bacterium]|nr:response regulator transcription factor [Candidatus Dormibacteraeota bacterium]
MEQATRLLIVEDDRALRETLSSTARAAGYQVATVVDGLSAVRAVDAGDVDIVLLDIGLPVMDGWAVLQRLGPRGSPPIIVISARGESADKVRALDGGADDYMAKPFGSDEVLARIRAVLRRTHPPAEVARVVRAGTVTVDLGTHRVTRGGTDVRLSPTEYLLVAELARNAGEVLDHRTLLARVWGPAYAQERNYLWTFVARLRRKLEEDPASPTIIVTAGQRGYRFGNGRS